ncbi:MAG: hypothetical protein ACHQII_02970 [Bacteroidia bacterium]
MVKKISTSFLIFFIFISGVTWAQSPELAMRNFASVQIKKGVRAIGMGGNGATWGNYSLIYRDSSSALVDAGATTYSNNNSFSFTAVGVTSPILWRGLALYAIAQSQYANNIATTLKSPGLGNNAVAVHGDGADQGIYIKAAMPLGKGFSVGVLLSYERSQFNAISDLNPANYVRYHTNWRPSVGAGVTWQPNKRLLIGFRGRYDTDMEVRTDNLSTASGLNASGEYRLGIAIMLWKGALIDLGGTAVTRNNKLNNLNTINYAPNLGFEQNLFKRHLALRAGLDETSPTCGFTLRIKPIVLDVAYVNNLGMARVNNLFGTNSNSLIATLTFYFANKVRKA